jgi:hypothetical protein
MERTHDGEERTMQLTHEAVAFCEATDALLVEARRDGMAPALVASLRAELHGLRAPVLEFYGRVDAALAGWRSEAVEEKWRRLRREWLGAHAQATVDEE